MIEKEYYKDELARLVDDGRHYLSIKVWDSLGEHSKTLNLTNECIDVLIDFLKAQREKNNDKTDI